MKIKEFFKKKSGAIATYNSLVETPKREDFNMEDGIIIDEWKDYFLQILSQNITLTSKSLHDENCQDELDMNLDLLMKISFDYENEVLTLEEKRTKSLITYAKLGLYLNKKIKLEKEIKFKIIALMELQEGLLNNIKVRYIINRRNCIRDEVNNLLGILCIFKNQKSAIYNKVNACSLEYKTIVNGNEEIVDNEYLCDRYQKLMEYANALLTYKEMDDVESFNEIVNKIASLERYFEMYVYLHSKDIDKMREIIDVYNQFIKNRHDKPKEFSFDDLIKLEIRFRVFDEFGRDIVNIEDLYNLYSLKFNYTVVDIYENHDNPLFLSFDDKRRDFTEYAIYGQIIMEMIEDLKTDKYGKLTSQFDIEKEDFWLKFNAILNPSNDNMDDSRYLMYDVNDILMHNLSLAFLWAVHNFDLNNFFHKYKIETPEYIQRFIDNRFYDIFFDKSDEHNDIQIEEKIPIGTFIKIFNVLDKMHYVDSRTPRPRNLTDYGELEYFQNYILIRLANIYPMILNDAKEYKRGRQLGYYYVPEGIVKLLRVQRPTLVAPVKSILIDSLITPGLNMCLCTPKTLKELNTSALDNTKITGLVLNEGLQRFIIDKKSKPISVSKLVIPSTLKFEEYDEEDVDSLNSNDDMTKKVFGFNVFTLNEIHFTNFRNSITLNDREFMRMVLSKMIHGVMRDSIENKYFFKCNLHMLYMWSCDYNDYNHMNCCIYRREIEQIIEKMARSHYGIYVKAVKSDYAKNLLADLVMEKIILMVYEKCGFMLCDDKNIKELKKLKRG